MVVGERYDSYESWRIRPGARAVGVAAGMAIGTMLAKPPTSSTTIVVNGTSYMYKDGDYFARVINAGEVVYQAVPAPAGAIITTLPAGCSSVSVGGATYSQCGGTHYQRVSSGYQVVVLN